MAGDNPTVRRRRLGLILRLMRTDAGLTGEEVGRRLERSESWVSRVETARQALRPRDLRDLLDLYGITNVDIRRELEVLTRDAKERRWWHEHGASVSGTYASYIGFEDEASALFSYDSIVVNGLLQTEDYARSLQRRSVPPVAGEAADRLIQVRLTRQRRLDEPSPPLLCALLDESVLHRRFSSTEAHRAQLHHLADLAERPAVTIQILPLARSAHVGMTAAFTVIDFPPPDQPVVFSEVGSGMSMADESETQRYRAIFDGLRAASLGEAESLALIRELARQLT